MQYWLDQSAKPAPHRHLSHTKSADVLQARREKMTSNSPPLTLKCEKRRVKRRRRRRRRRRRGRKGKRKYILGFHISGIPVLPSLPVLSPLILPSHSTHLGGRPARLPILHTTSANINIPQCHQSKQSCQGLLSPDRGGLWLSL